MPIISIRAPGMPLKDIGILEQQITNLGEDYQIRYELEESHSFGQKTFDFIALTIHSPNSRDVAETVVSSLINEGRSFAMDRYSRASKVNRPQRVSLYGPDNRRIGSKEIDYNTQQ